METMQSGVNDFKSLPEVVKGTSRAVHTDFIIPKCLMEVNFININLPLATVNLFHYQLEVKLSFMSF